MKSTNTIDNGTEERSLKKIDARCSTYKTSPFVFEATARERVAIYKGFLR